ncbi:hypothetical protein [Raoultella scottii]|jgi:hypothetical protein|uniref:hypothetical protein n=1 Tax=Raoultella scottii TaxID=3040937 RepID=UPI002FA8E195|nr:hypothetical protein [Klebsiella pneumoniae]
MREFRVFSTCLDRAGYQIPVTWRGYASSSDAAIRKMEHEAKSNGWSVALIVFVQQRRVVRDKSLMEIKA